MSNPKPVAVDVIFALGFMLAVAAGTYWLVTILNDRFAEALAQHLMSLARGAGG